MTDNKCGYKCVFKHSQSNSVMISSYTPTAEYPGKQESPGMSQDVPSITQMSFDPPWGAIITEMWQQTPFFPVHVCDQ